jgi:hypothetical protein
MKSIDHIERLLGQTPAPSVVEGPHREQLKQRLLEYAQSAQPRREPVKISVFRRMPSLVKLAAAVLVAAVLIGTGWAAEKIYKMVTSEQIVIAHVAQSGNTTTQFSTSAANPAEEEKKVNEEVRQLVALKKYKLVETIHHPDGRVSYVYFFRLSDGGRLKWKMPPPRLEDVASWDEYEQKSKEYSDQRQKEIEKAIASGRGRLIDILVTEIHECRDVGTHERLDVHRSRPECPQEGTHDWAYVYPGGYEKYEKPGDHVFKTSSWQDHLNAIRDGKRKLLDIRLVKEGVYETVREDGSKLIYSRELPPEEKPKTK